MPTTDGSHSAEELAALGLLTFTASSGEASRTYSKDSEASSTGKEEAHTGQLRQAPYHFSRAWAISAPEKAGGKDKRSGVYQLC